MDQEQIIVTTPPQQLGALRGHRVTAAHLAYRLGKGPRLYRAAGLPPRPGGLMVIGQGDYNYPGPVEPFCHEVLRECSARGFRGVLLDLDARLPFLEQLADRLDQVLSCRGLTFLVPEPYGDHAPGAQVLISSALSGGTLQGRLMEARERFGRDRVALALERTAEDFFLPSPSGCGDPLSKGDLNKLLQQRRPSVFFSGGLCARYFTYLDGSGGPHFVLFDDGDTMHRKLEVGRRAGVSTFVLPYTELSCCLPIDAGQNRG